MKDDRGPVSYCVENLQRMINAKTIESSESTWLDEGFGEKEEDHE